VEAKNLFFEVIEIEKNMLNYLINYIKIRRKI